MGDRAAFRPGLATSLNNLSTRQSDAGNRAGALASITEAVELRRALAAANPAAFLPDRAGSLNNLSVQLALNDAGNDGGADIWRETIDRLPNSAARAELRAAWAERLWTRTGLWAASPNPRR